ncbi:deoxyribonuclease-1-like [Trematomus bernacchii]|uniref:deoxyribonuclease-1-like n=1 Tax=Trematomus bernacchii TaxID=40690 RepID=UPI00146C7FF3|nr:deoxyribonuclease-1-like [Trematomus bernacchii]
MGIPSFLCRDETVTVTDSFQYNDKGFSRPPFVVKFSSTQTAVKEFVLIPIHTKPGNAVKEIDALVDVVKKAKLKWKNNNIMVLGDFNADGKHVKKKDWKKIRLLDTNKKDFHWLIANGVDTTLAAKSSNTYDRIVVTTEMEKGVVAGSAKVFDFREEYDLRDKAKKVSDHFPVEVELEAAGAPALVPAAPPGPEAAPRRRRSRRRSRKSRRSRRSQRSRRSRSHKKTDKNGFR